MGIQSATMEFSNRLYGRPEVMLITLLIRYGG